MSRPAVSDMGHGLERLDDHELAYLTALAGLWGVGPSRLMALIDGRAPSAAWAAILNGRAHEWPPVVPTLRGVSRPQFAKLVERWRIQARGMDPAGFLALHRRAGVHVLVSGAPGYPNRLVGHPEAPPVVFVDGDPRVADLPTVGIVGTRRATDLGRSLARDFGRDLAAMGIAVVSGLALGIDGAAHRGALDAKELASERGGAQKVGPPVAVVAGGPDNISPPSNAEIWRAVARSGMVLAEAPLGVGGQPWRFAARNRIVAMLSDVLVVVESHTKGGSMYTVEAALQLGTPVMAVPGSVRSRASSGTNQLLFDGADMCRTVDDILARLATVSGYASVAREVQPELGAVGDVPSSTSVGPMSSDGAHLLDLLNGDLLWTDDLVERSGWPPGRVIAALAELEALSVVGQERGRWRVLPLRMTNPGGEAKA